MRLLYGKFYSNETTHTSSKDTKTNKRATIIQFLSNCSEYELNYFFNLLFDSLNVVLDDLTGQEQQQNKQQPNADKYALNTSNISDKFLCQLLAVLNNTTGKDSIYDLKKVIPLKKLLGILHSLEIIINKLARQMESFSHRILQILCFIHRYAYTINELVTTTRGDAKAAAATGQQLAVDDYHVGLLKVNLLTIIVALR